MKLLNKRTESLIGLDISEKLIKFAQLEPSAEGMVLSHFEILEIPTSIDRKEAIKETLSKIFFRRKLEDSKIFASIGGPKVAIRRLLVPEMPDEELSEAIRWEARSTIPFPIDKVAMEHYVIGKAMDKGVEKLEILVAACENEVLNEHIKMIEEAGLKCAGVIPTPFALSDLIKPRKFSEGENIALIDIGGEVASINLFKNSILRFTREINLAGESITSAITGMFISEEKKISLSASQAKRIKEEYGIPSLEGKTKEGIPLSQILEAMKPTLQKVLNEILRSFDYYKEQFRETKINKVYLTGGSAKLKNLANFLSAGLGTPVEIFDTLAGITIHPQLANVAVLKASSGQLAVAIGLAINQGETINFVRKRVEAKTRFEIKKIFEGIKLPEIPNVALVSTLILIVFLTIAYNFYLEFRIGGLKMELISKQGILEDVKALKDRREILLKIKSEETQLRDTLSKFTELLPTGVSLSSLSYNNGLRSMVIMGEAGTVTLVGNFLKNIEISPYFSDANLVETKKTVVDGKKMMSFKISFHVD